MPIRSPKLCCAMRRSDNRLRSLMIVTLWLSVSGNSTCEPERRCLLCLTFRVSLIFVFCSNQSPITPQLPIKAALSRNEIRGSFELVNALTRAMTQTHNAPNRRNFSITTFSLNSDSYHNLPKEQLRCKNYQRKCLKLTIG